jgi:mRNA-degrading endonuclease RelE of RelBE toxin-antitoxin system
VIDIEVLPRLRKTAARLGPDITAKVEEVLRAVQRDFGNPHRHGGLGLRKLGRNSYEARVWLQWRVVFIHRGGVLLAYDIMNHDEVSRWLK